MYVCILDPGLTKDRIYKEFLHFNNKKTAHVLKIGKRLELTLHQEDTQGQCTQECA
jgi:hypothetical protein